MNYLKVITRKNPKYFTLLGTKNNNIFVCKERKSCLFEGYKGADIFYQSRKNIYITDFNEKDDRIVLKDRDVKVRDRKGFVYLDSNDGDVYIYGKDKAVIEGWLKQAKNEGGSKTDKELEALPIIIK